MRIRAERRRPPRPRDGATMSGRASSGRPARHNGRMRSGELSYLAVIESQRAAQPGPHQRARRRNRDAARGHSARTPHRTELHANDVDARALVFVAIVLLASGCGRQEAALRRHPTPAAKVANPTTEAALATVTLTAEAEKRLAITLRRSSAAPCRTAARRRRSYRTAWRRDRRDRAGGRYARRHAAHRRPRRPSGRAARSNCPSAGRHGRCADQRRA